MAGSGNKQEGTSPLPPSIVINLTGTKKFGEKDFELQAHSDDRYNYSTQVNIKNVEDQWRAYKMLDFFKTCGLKVTAEYADSTQTAKYSATPPISSLSVTGKESIERLLALVQIRNDTDARPSTLKMNKLKSLSMIPLGASVSRESLFFARAAGHALFENELLRDRKMVEAGRFFLTENGERHKVSIEEYKTYEARARELLYGEDGKSGVAAMMNDTYITEILTAAKTLSKPQPNMQYKVVQDMASAYVSGFSQMLLTLEPEYAHVHLLLNSQWRNR